MDKKLITRAAYVRSSSIEMADEESRQVEFVISSEAVDTYNTVFRMDGWDLSRYKQNPIVAYQHRALSDNPDDIMGISDVYVDGNQLIGRVTFEPADINPKAEKVYRKVLNGTLKMASISAEILDGRMGEKEQGEDPDILYFTKQNLREWSIVSLGSNPDALKRNQEDVEEMRTEILKNIEVNSQKDKKENRASSLDEFEAQHMFNLNKK